MAQKIPPKVKVINAYKDLFRTPAGKTVLLNLMTRFHMTSSTFDPNDRESARKQGEQNVVLHILSEMHVDERMLFEMIEEANKPEGE